ncbi:N-acetylmuramoyl-L-alanine amidase [Eubacterium oxidoreducens]|uniref:N-acetylmuramoyl-L-alanine amidase n=1 Tax=Eubacterium oxidoreducens TaxID=1732 RepID=A0A1G6ADK8_EUBOX|nr:N-acetylmuramoyl-L-alanine amidase [Eubacterium oxidoreducens]SDB06462.1 N-acetylmuramoyl-L-alanine amidase [Eubacterium oxidoreducens]
MLKVKSIVASILCAGMIFAGVGEYVPVLASDNTDANEEQAITYLVVNTPAVEYGETQEILVGIEDDIEVEQAQLYFENTQTKQEYQIDAQTVSDESLIFSYDYDDDKMQGEYQISRVILTTTSGDEISCELNELDMEAIFGLGVVVETKPDAYVEDEQLAQAIENTEIVATDANGKVLSDSSLSTALAAAASGLTLKSIAKGASTNKIVVLDPGHDSTHCGTHANSLQEETLVLKIANYCKEELETYQGVTVYMTRTSAQCPYPGTTSTEDNAKRVTYANSVNADIYVSLHLNSAASTSTSGAEVYYPNSNGENSIQKAVGTQGKTLAQLIENELVAAGLTNRGIKIRNSESGDSFSNGTLMDYYGIIRKAKTYGIPAVIVEHCYQSSTSDAGNYLKSEAGLKKLGVADATGIATYLGLSKTSTLSTNTTITLSKAVSTTTGKIKLSWSPVSTATGYKIYQSSDNKKFTKVLTVKGNTTDTATVSVASGVKYYYKVRAYKKSGSTTTYSAYSSVLAAVSLAKTTAKLTVITGTTTGLKISWTKVTGCKGYLVYRSTSSDSGFTKVATIKDASTLTYTDTSAQVDTKYYYKVRAYKKYSGGTSKASASNCVSGTIKSEISITKTKATSSNKMKLTWSKVSGAKKYEVYRATSASGTYKKLATIASSKLTYTDQTATAGKTYYYKVRAQLASGYTTFSATKAAKTVAKTVISKIYGSGATTLKIKWGKVSGASGYIVYKSTSSSKGFTRIASVSGETTCSYTDKNLTAGKTYYYKIKAYVVNNSLTGYGSVSKAVGLATYTSATSLTVVKSASGADVSLSWKSLSGAEGYYIYRSTSKSSGYKKVGTVSGKTTVTYKDTTTSAGKTYYYKIRPFKTGYQAKSAGKYSSAVAVDVLQKATISKIENTASGMTLSWKSVTGADGYIVYYSTDGSSYKTLATVKSKTSYTDTKTYTGDELYYRVRAYAAQTGAKGYGSYGKVGGYKIMMDSSASTQNVTVAQMVAFYKASGKSYPASTYKNKGAATIEEFCQIVYDEATAEGVKAEVLFSQICLETAYLQFGGVIKASQCNFGGLGAVDSGGSATTATFSSVTEGIRAQVQHLKAYACSESLVNTCVDTRFKYVTRGVSPFIETLSIAKNPAGKGWASDCDYGTKLKTNINGIKSK